MKMNAARARTARGTRGYATMAAVSSMSLVILAMLVYTLSANIRNFDSQARAQVKQDYSQKEDAILNALLHIVPNKAIGAMQRGSASNASAYTWDTIFQEALSIANAEQAISPQMLNALNLATSISSNTGDTQFQNASQLVQAPAGTALGGSNRVNGGNWWEYTMLGDAKIGPKLPAALQLSQANAVLDKQYPLITFDKTHVDWYTKGLGLSPNLYPLYNLIQYPDVKFGYKRPGEYFVAKRNWWVFSLNFGSHNQERTGIPPVRKDYVLSIYEIPSQVPLSASALMKVGRFADGTAWQNVSIDGSLVAEQLRTEGTVVVSNGAVSARKSLDLSGSTVVDGETIASNFDDLGQRETRATQSGSGANNGDFYQASVGGNVGKVAFIPINRGNDTLLSTTDGNRSERISPTGWNHYSQAGPKAAMTLEIRKMSSSNNQMPTQIRLTYRNSSNGISTLNYTRGNTGSTAWPTEQQSGGSAFPFQTGELDNQRKALIIHMDRLPAFINSLSGSGGMALNHSLLVFPRTGDSTVKIPSIPSLETDMAISLRGGKNLSAYTAGFSLVSRYRVYIADTLNNVAIPTPANSGLPSGYTFYPPLSIFAPEKRFGESLTIQHPVEMTGQLNSLKTGANDTVTPLELMGGSDQRIAADNIDANLISLKSPAELPPVYMMNWLVTIEEVH